jgi:hypothetical protein
MAHKECAGDFHGEYRKNRSRERLNEEKKNIVRAETDLYGTEKKKDFPGDQNVSCIKYF